MQGIIQYLLFSRLGRHTSIGNSKLKGIKRRKTTLNKWPTSTKIPAAVFQYLSTFVKISTVIYSFHCLSACNHVSQTEFHKKNSQTLQDTQSFLDVAWHAMPIISSSSRWSLARLPCSTHHSQSLISQLWRACNLHDDHNFPVQLGRLEGHHHPMLCVRVAQSCLTLCNPMDWSPPGSSVHGILQTRILEWVAISFSRGSSQLREQAQVSCIAGRFFTVWVWKPLQREPLQREIHAKWNKCNCLLMPGFVLHLLTRSLNNTARHNRLNQLDFPCPIQPRCCCCFPLFNQNTAGHMLCASERKQSRKDSSILELTG